MNFDFLKRAKFWEDTIGILLALLISAAGVYYFILPGKLVMGSISGLAIVVADLLAAVGITMKVSTIVFLFNAILIVIAYIFLGKEVGLKTVVASLLLGPFMNLWEKILPYEKLIEPGMTSVMGDPIFDILAFILFIGAAQSFLFRINASTGGIDIIVLIVQKYLHMEIGTAVSIAGIAVCCTGFLIHPFRMVAIGIIGTWLNGLVVDYFTSNLNKKKRVCIISPDSDKIRSYIIHTLNRGCSLYAVKGGFSGEEKEEIQVLLTQREFSKLLDFIRENDLKTFITAGNCSEIYGLWRNSSMNHRLTQETGKDS